VIELSVGFTRQWRVKLTDIKIDNTMRRTS
jgi:hypothetical protein